MNSVEEFLDDDYWALNDSKDSVIEIGSDRFKRVYIRGELFGTILVRRNDSPEDLHICIYLISSDGNDWHLNDSSAGFSSGWLPDLQKVLSDTEQWLRQNADPYKQYGYQFKF